MIWPRKTPRDRATVVLGIRPYFDAGWFNYPKYIAQDLLVVVVSLVARHKSSFYLWSVFFVRVLRRSSLRLMLGFGETDGRVLHAGS